MRNLLERLSEVLSGGGAAVLAAVTAGRGSVPRGAGAQMLVEAAGRTRGTVGGGAVEHEAEVRAQALLSGGGAAACEVFRLYPNRVRDIGMVCGGEVEIWFRRFGPGDLPLVERALALLEERTPFWLACDLSAEGVLALCRPGGTLWGAEAPPAVLGSLGPRPAIIEAEGRRWFSERLLSPERVWIFGGGHVSQALVPALAAVDFRCVVLEDRADFCLRELFPGAEEVRHIDMARALEEVPITSEDYVIIMTRGHRDDLLLQEQVLRTPARYIGVIGSRRKKAALFAQLRERGFTDADLERITTPIGLSIGAETPAEIAVSIAAQLIQVRASQ